MRLIKIIPLFFLILMACQKSADDTTPEANYQPPVKVNIAGAKALYIGNISKDKSNDKFGVLYKIISNDKSETVSFFDKDGREIDIDCRQLFSISDNLLLLKCYITKSVDDQLVSITQEILLIRKNDGAIFVLGRDGDEILANFLSLPSMLLVDENENVYWAKERIGGTILNTKYSIYKMATTGTDVLSATLVSGDLNCVRWCSIDNKNVIIMYVPGSGCMLRFPDGVFAKVENLKFNYDYSEGTYFLPVKESNDGGFIYLESIDFDTKFNILKITPNLTSHTATVTKLMTINKERETYVKRDDLPDGGVVLYSSDYKYYIYITAKGEVRQEVFDAGFPYKKKVLSDGYVYGMESNTLYRMSFDTHMVEQFFLLDSKYLMTGYSVSPTNSTIEVLALRYADARQVIIKIDSAGAILSENNQPNNIEDIIYFTRL